jgi:predicted TIM-barrel fold metal-dependent hydrolase
MQIEDFQPLPNLVTKNTLIKRARFGVVDVHNHLDDEYGGGWIHRPLSAMLSTLDDLNIKTFVDLDGGLGEKTLRQHLDKLKTKAPETFKVFGGIAWDAWESLGDKFPEWAAGRVREQVGWGADGLAIFKNFGLHVRDQAGLLAAINDPRLNVLWDTVAELNLPVLMQVADPVAFFEPLDQHNERWEELNVHPEWQFPSPPFPKFMTLMDAFANLVEKHPRVTFIGAHMAGYSENLAWVSKLLDRCPNLYVDIAARISELGRQPYTSRRFFLKHSDRILFGLDHGLDKGAYQTCFRFLETDDEYFNYSQSEIPHQGRWYIYGLGLPDGVLEKVYSENARRALRIV